MPHVVTMCLLCCGSCQSVKRGSGAVRPGGVGTLGGMFILSTAFDLLLLITSCILYMNQAALRCSARLTGDTGRGRGGAAILDFLNREKRAGLIIKLMLSLAPFNNHPMNVLTTVKQ